MEKIKHGSAIDFPFLAAQPRATGIVCDQDNAVDSIVQYSTTLYTIPLN